LLSTLTPLHNAPTSSHAPTAGIIIPSHYTFYDFVINKTLGKSGLLFDPAAPPTADTETSESRIGKIVDRLWYERNKQHYPASQWEVFDPQRDYGRVHAKAVDKLYDFF
jgi:protein FAM50